MKKKSILAVFMLCAHILWPQEDQQLVLKPGNPAAGSEFFLEGLLPGVDPLSLVVLEPLTDELVRYEGCDIQPLDHGAGSKIVFRFLALAPGSSEISLLSVRQGKKLFGFNTVTVQISGQRAEKMQRYGYWSFPLRVYERQSFYLAAMNPDGQAVPVPGLALEGAVIQPSGQKEHSYSISAYKSGKLFLPEVHLADEQGSFFVDKATVMVLSVGTARASSGPWELRLHVQNDAFVGSLVSWELEAKGPEEPGLALAPDLLLLDPDGMEAELIKNSYGDINTREHFSKIGIRGAFVAGKAGKWQFVPKSYEWLDPNTGDKKQAAAKKHVLLVLEKETELWTPPAFIVEEANKAAKRLDKKQAVLQVVKKGDLANLYEKKLVNKREVLDQAMVILASESGLPLKAEAYGILLRTEKLALFYPGLKKAISLLDEAFGNQRPAELFLFWWLIFAVILLLPAFLFFKKSAKAVLLTSVAAVICVLLLFILVSGKALHFQKRFVSLGGQRFSVPSAQAADIGPAAPGLSGKVIESAGPWLWLETDNGALFWMQQENVMYY
ncbi:hypothetical protein MASR2M29_18520 [Spirochaetota bacterium]